ncbi:MAG TPA: glycoside hydrolase family 52 protein [Chthoniobacteraceae bacterium]|jgi:hypothetical protein|nr:glycoside hydrolase family 52 protein [Chthoniobacteraceae bacterium]
MKSIFYNTQHSPIGAFASLTLGAKGAKGGLGLELAKPADQNVYIGCEDADGNGFSCLPFFDSCGDEVMHLEGPAARLPAQIHLRQFEDERISRVLTPCRDVWKAGDIEFAIFTPGCPAPDPGRASARDLRLAYAPALALEMVIDNTRGRIPRRAFFGFMGNDPTCEMRRLDDTSRGRFVGIGCGRSKAIASRSGDVQAAQGLSVQEILRDHSAESFAFGIGRVALLIATIPAGEKRKLEFTVCFHRAGIVTTGLDASYHYARHFPDVESVAVFALRNYSALKQRGADFEERFQSSNLSDARKFMLAQAVHSYYGSTQLLDVRGEPMWIVNEGEYRLINTLDLTVDQLYFEMELNPWTVRNELDWFAKRYSYKDRIQFPGSDRAYLGGISFTHDMGKANHLSRPGFSAYEKGAMRGCYSHMTHEELVNWLICALTYEHRTRDTRWLAKTMPLFDRCLQSLLRRDHPNEKHRDGIMSLDSARCCGTGEITTYDSLDASLGQARNSVYLAVKCWGVYVGLAAFYRRNGNPAAADVCETQAALCALNIVSSADADGFLPAILHENVFSRIIPAVEGLIIPYLLELKELLEDHTLYGGLVPVLKRHLRQVMRPGVCLFPDGGWKISSTSDNSWLSKTYLCQFVAEHVLGMEMDMESADEAHASWLLDERNLYWAWSDQMVAGEARGSRYYPRGVTSILWLKQTGSTLDGREIANAAIEQRPRLGSGNGNRGHYRNGNVRSPEIAARRLDGVPL